MGHPLHLDLPRFEAKAAAAARLLKALSNEHRLMILCKLTEGELSVGDLSSLVGCQIPNMSQHLSVLRTAGLVTTRRDGSTVFYRLADPRVLEAYRLIQDIAR
jgi:ArsR family transcriptional regulator